MSSYTYTWTLTDIGLGALTAWMPVVTVRPAVSAFGPNGLVSDVRVPVTATGGVYSATLIPSGELTPASGGSTGVDYIIEVGRFELADDLTKIWHGTEAWQFTATVGGGSVADMTGRPLEGNVPWGFGPPPPTLTRGLYYDISNGEMYGEPGGF